MGAQGQPEGHLGPQEPARHPRLPAQRPRLPYPAQQSARIRDSNHRLTSDLGNNQGMVPVWRFAWSSATRGW
jgi:hypothetical protein